MKRLFRSKMAWSIAIATVAALGVFGYNQVNAGARQDCDNNAIIYCGAQTPGDFINKVNGNNPADLQAIYQNFGLAPAEYNKFVTSAKMGTAYKDGRIVVDGQTVATNAWSIGRLGNHDGQTYKRSYTIAGHTYYASDNKDVFKSDNIPVMVMFDEKGAMKFAALTACGNPITGNKTNPNYTCDLLQKQAVEGQKNTYSFTTKASATNGASLAKVVYDFGDGSAPVTQNDLATPVNHTYTKEGNYTAKVTVYVNLPGGGQTSVTGAQCQTQITVEAPPVVVYTCDSLEALPAKDNELEYTFQANTSSTNATLSGADFDFGDGMDSQNVTPGKNGNVVSVDHTYTKAGDYTVKATVHFDVKGDDGQKTVKSANCEAKINTKVCSVNPNLPPNSPQCKVCKYNHKLPADSAKCAKPAATVLPNTGAGDILGLFAGASLVGFAAYRLYLSRRFLRG